MYRDRDFGPILERAISGLFKRPFLNACFCVGSTDQFLRRSSAAGILLDEDVSIRRIFYVLGEKLGIPVFTVSHGIPCPVIRKKEDRGQPPYFDSSTLFVNSEFEKDSYLGIFYKESRLIVTGTPRYDRLRAMQSEITLRKTPAALTNILYCTGTMLTHDISRLTAVGEVLFSKSLCREYTEKYLRSIVAVCEKLENVSLRIKPHYQDFESFPVFREVQDHLGCRCEILPHSADIFLLESEADVIVTAESTVICEALMLVKPVIVLDYTGYGLSGDYEKNSVVFCAKNETELENFLRRLVEDSSARQKLAEAWRKKSAYYTGPFDGNNTRRVVDYIREHMKNDRSAGSS